MPYTPYMPYMLICLTELDAVRAAQSVVEATMVLAGIVEVFEAQRVAVRAVVTP